MPVGDFPTVFSTILKWWLNRMVTSENGIIHTHMYIYMRCKNYIICIHVHTYWMILDVSKRGVLGSADDDIAFFLHSRSFLIDHEQVFLGKYLFILHIVNNNTMLHVFCISWHCLLFMERFVCNLHAYSAYLQYMAHGRSKMRQEFWSFRGFRTKQIGLECPSGIFPLYSPW